MSEISKKISIKTIDKETKDFDVIGRNDLSEEMENTVIKAFRGLLEYVGIHSFNSEIKNYSFLESFIFSNLAKPKYQQDEYVLIENNFLERIPNKTLCAKVGSVIVDDNKCEILYLVNYYVDDVLNFKVVKETDIMCKQEKDFSNENYYGRDELERFQYMQMKRRINKVSED